MLIKKLRKNRGLYQYYVAKKLGLSNRQYSRIENGIQKPSEKQLQKLAKIFNCSESLISDQGSDECEQRIS